MENSLDMLVVFAIMMICPVYCIYNAIKKCIHSLGKGDFIKTGLYGYVTLLLMVTWMKGISILAEITLNSV